MDASLYDGFDNRAQRYFLDLVSVTNHKVSKRKKLRELKKLFIAEVRRALPLASHDIQALHHSFYIAYYAFHDIERRDGEAYIFHVLRGAFVLVWAFERFRVRDTHLVTRLLHLMLQHDSFEETAEMFYRGILVRALIRIRLERKVTIGVSHLTQGIDEKDEQYHERMLVEATWEELLVKVVERTDNIFKLERKGNEGIERSKKKLADTMETFTRLIARLNELVSVDIRAGRISPVWKDLVSFLADYLWFAVNTMKARPEFKTA